MLVGASKVFEHQADTFLNGGDSDSYRAVDDKALGKFLR